MSKLSQQIPSGNTKVEGIWDLLPENSAATSTGVLAIGGVPVTELVAEYGTPLHIFDEKGLREQARRFRQGLRSRWEDSDVLFASKSLPIVAMYKLAAEEGLCIDVAGGGELQLALAAGVDPARIYFHGNAKTDAEIQMALESGVGTIIVDNFDEISRLERFATSPQKVLLRLIPGVNAETHASQATGGNDSKFGLPLSQAGEAIQRMQEHELIEFEGVHLHIGSQILNTHQFAEAVRNISGAGSFSTYDIGGGLGVKYTYSEVAPTVDEYLEAIVRAAKEVLPPSAKLLIEPGRSLVARAGVTAYSVVSVKDTGKHFVAVDGGLADQMDIALTGQRYEALVANKLFESWDVSTELVGRQCESGDLLVSGAAFPRTEIGDVVVLATTGAYSYTMTNNYNGALRPAIVFVNNGGHRLVARRETYEDLLRLHEPAIAA